MPRVIVFDLIGTLLDLQAMDAHFERFFGDAVVRKEWFTQTLQLAMASVMTSAYEDFRVQADTALEITARRYKVSMLGEEKNLILGTLQKLRSYSDVAQNLQRLRDAGLRLATLTNSLRLSSLAPTSARGFFSKYRSNTAVRSRSSNSCMTVSRTGCSSSHSGSGVVGCSSIQAFSSRAHRRCSLRSAFDAAKRVLV